MGIRDEKDILNEIKLYDPYFEDNKFLEAVKYEVKKIYITLCEGNENEYNNCNCTQNVINKLLENKEEFRISKDMDSISVQYANLHDYIAGFIQVYLSIYFYDKTSNNEENIDNSDKYYNDIWIVSYKKESLEDVLKCTTCGATMKKDELNNILECPYCNNKRYYNFKIGNWRIEDIEKEE